MQYIIHVSLPEMRADMNTFGSEAGRAEILPFPLLEIYACMRSEESMSGASGGTDSGGLELRALHCRGQDSAVLVAGTRLRVRCRNGSVQERYRDNKRYLFEFGRSF